eukprot:TRINITY_DN64914_c0_g1_i1.p1 TRINITY_DN64914_c0_g1~~TRINITY_DN64914_c0_g1_i1.p1  ORF type:complete len:747 (-),score=72.90 TRINITY_DN64914_c0_g1_i1:1099-3339(-)
MEVLKKVVAALDERSDLTERQKLISDACSPEGLGPSNTQMRDIAKYTFNGRYLPEIVQELMWTIDREPTPTGAKTIHKGLILIDYLIRNGSEVMVGEIEGMRSPIYSLTRLYRDDGEQYKFVRHRARKICKLLADPDMIVEERRQAREIQSKCTSFSSDSLGGGGGGRGGYRDHGGYDDRYAGPTRSTRGAGLYDAPSRPTGGPGASRRSATQPPQFMDEDDGRYGPPRGMGGGSGHSPKRGGGLYSSEPPARGAPNRSTGGLYGNQPPPRPTHADSRYGGGRDPRDRDYPPRQGDRYRNERDSMQHRHQPHPSERERMDHMGSRERGYPQHSSSGGSGRQPYPESPTSGGHQERRYPQQHPSSHGHPLYDAHRNGDREAGRPYPNPEHQQHRNQHQHHRHHHDHHDHHNHNSHSHKAPGHALSEAVAAEEWVVRVDCTQVADRMTMDDLRRAFKTSFRSVNTTACRFGPANANKYPNCVEVMFDDAQEYIALVTYMTEEEGMDTVIYEKRYALPVEMVGHRLIGADDEPHSPMESPEAASNPEVSDDVSDRQSEKSLNLMGFDKPNRPPSGLSKAADDIFGSLPEASSSSKPQTQAPNFDDLFAGSQGVSTGDHFDPFAASDNVFSQAPTGGGRPAPRGAGPGQPFSQTTSSSVPPKTNTITTQQTHTNDRAAPPPPRRPDPKADPLPKSLGVDYTDLVNQQFKGLTGLGDEPHQPGPRGKPIRQMQKEKELVAHAADVDASLPF